jgi:alpha-beta hydrolase superfamily lysophospholipase
MPASGDDGTIATFSASDGYALHYRHHAPQMPLRGQIVAIHGIQSHGGWYTASCRHLAQVGWEVFFLDRRGSGLNQQARGDTPNYHRLIGDIIEFIEAKCPQPPVLLGISWGGKLAVAVEQFAPKTTRGLILLTPGLCARIRPTLRERLAIGLSRLIAPGRRFRIPLDDPELFTGTPSWQAFIRDDPLALRQATARFLVESARLDWRLRGAASSIRVPALLLLAGQDRIIDNEKTRRYVQAFEPRCEVIEYPHAHHTLEFEADPQPVFTDMARWLDAHAPGS